MTTLQIKPNNDFEINITVKESDEYSKKILVRFDSHLMPEDLRGCNEMFLTVDELEKIGRFLLRQSDEIRAIQNFS